MIFFHALSGGFFVDEIHGPRTLWVSDPDWVRPEDDRTASAPWVEIDNVNCSLPPAAELVAVTESDYRALLDAQTGGLLIQANQAGHPEAVEQPPLPAAEREYGERLWRDAALSATDRLVARHRDEIEAERATTLTVEQYRELQAYRLGLRTWPESPEFPVSTERPTPPAWLTGITS